jgi:hypothetical protein
MRLRLAPSFLALLAFSSILVLGCAAAPERFGAPLTPGPEVAVADLLAAPEAHDGSDLTVVGTIADVCAKKGCWMVLAAGGREMRVTFLDYGFFVPTDSEGAEVRAAGRFAIREVPVDEARHYLEDQGRHAEAQAIVAPVPSFTFVATGVELVR